MRTGFGAAVIGALAARIGADDQQIGARRLALVRDPGRDHDDVAGAQFDGLAVVAAEPHPRGAGGDAQYLMRRAVIR